MTGAAAPGRWQAAIVDLDGTLVDTLGDFDAALGGMLAELGLPAVPREFIARTVGQGSEHLIRSTLAQVCGAAVDDALHDRAWQAYQRHYRRVNGHHSSVYPGAAEGLQRLRERGLRLACLTNKPTAFAQALLLAKGLEAFFERVHGGDAFERKKPDPLPVLRTCAELAVEPGRTLVVGDSSNDARAARAAGCAVVLVDYGYNHGLPVESLGADALLPRLDHLDLEALAARLSGSRRPP
jgi:phosphoglycolate phosphatase